MSDNLICWFPSIYEWDAYIQVFIDPLFSDIRNHGKTYDQNLAINVEYIIGDEKCYFPCMQCKWIKIIIVFKGTSKKHLLEHGHLEGGK